MARMKSMKSESEDKLQEACAFLKLVVGENAYDNISSGLRIRINKFLREQRKAT